MIKNKIPAKEKYFKKWGSFYKMEWLGFSKGVNMDEVGVNREEEKFDKKGVRRRSKVSAEIDYSVSERVKNAVY